MLGLKLVPVIVATLVFWFMGFLWYGVLFNDVWMVEQGVSASDAGGFDVYMLGGILITLMQVVGIGLVLKWKGDSDVVAAIKTTGLLWLLIALPFVSYAFLYLPVHSSTLLVIDASHLFVGWLAAAAILSLMK